jgi:hypothetical protein
MLCRGVYADHSIIRRPTTSIRPDQMCLLAPVTASPGCDGPAPGSSVRGRVMYVEVYDRSMRRTNIYLSEAEQVALDARAAAEGTTRSDVVRAIVDRELNLTDETALDEALSDAAAELAVHARKLSRTDPDLRVT